jgi:hypothetical protein
VQGLREPQTPRNLVQIFEVPQKLHLTNFRGQATGSNTTLLRLIRNVGGVARWKAARTPSCVLSLGSTRAVYPVLGKPLDKADSQQRQALEGVVKKEKLSRFGGSATRPTPLRHAYDATTLAAIETDQTLDTVFATLTGRMIAVAIANNGKPIGVLKRSDLLEYLAHQRRNSSR